MGPINSAYILRWSLPRKSSNRKLRSRLKRLNCAMTPQPKVCTLRVHFPGLQNPSFQQARSLSVVVGVGGARLEAALVQA
jgi:hypothetical protein